MTRTDPRRRGFTLVELLVAIAIAIVVLSLAIYLVNSATFDSYKVVGAGDRLSQWLVQAKTRALRDKAPRGLRLFVTAEPDQTNGGTFNVVRECAFIEQPEALYPSDPGSVFQILYRWNGTAYDSATPQQQPAASPGAAYLTLRGNDTTAFADLAAGDVIFVPDLRASYRIVTVTAGPTAADGVPDGATHKLELASLPDLGAANSYSGTTTPPTRYQRTASWQTTTFGVIRQPQVLLGEPTLLLGSGMAVDVAASRDGTVAVDTILSGTAPNQYYDILFAPGGEVLGNTSGFTGLLLRDINKLPRALTTVQADYDAAGEMIIVAVFPKTGAVATHPVANDTDAFRFAKEAANTGL